MALEPRDYATISAAIVATIALWWNRKTKGYEQAFSIAVWLIKEQVENWEYCLNTLSEKPFDGWNEEEKKKAASICGAFHIVGVLGWEKAIPRKLITRIFYYSLPETFKVLKPYLNEMRRKRGESYWIGFDLLLRVHLLNRRRAYRRAAYRLDVPGPPEMDPTANWRRRQWGQLYYWWLGFLDEREG